VCRRLARQPDVLAAGGIEKPTSVALSAAPATLFEAYRSTPEFVDVLVARGAPLAGSGLVAVGAALAQELGLVDGSSIEVPTQGRYAVEVIPPSVRADRFSRALIIPDLPEHVEECWVEWMPGTNDTRSLTESLLAVDAPLNVSAILTASAYSRDPFAQYTQRATRWWCVAVGAVAALAMALSLRARRRAMALYAAVGTSRWELATLFGLEALLVSTFGTVAGVACGLAVFAAGGEVTSFDVRTALSEAVFVPACVGLVTMLTLSARRHNVAAELKAD